MSVTNYDDPTTPYDDTRDNSLYDIDHAGTDEAIRQDAIAASAGDAFGSDNRTLHTLDYPGGGGAGSAGQQMLDAAQGVNSDIASGNYFGGQGSGQNGVTSPQGTVSGSLPTDAGQPPFSRTLAAPDAPNVGFSRTLANPDNLTTPNLPGGSGRTLAGGSWPGQDTVLGTTPNLPGGGGMGAPPTTGNNFITPLLDQKPTGALPGGGGAGGLPPQYANDPWAQTFYKEFGYFNPQFNSKENLLANAQRGDVVVLPQLERMAILDPSGDAKRVLDAIKGAPNFYGSQNAANWAGQHNQQIAGDLASHAYGTNQAAIQNVYNQGVTPNAHPVDNAHALMTDSMRQSLTDTLVGMGVDPRSIRTNFDPYGNETIEYTSKSGTPESIKASLVEMAGALQTLRDRAAAAAQQPAAAPPGGGGGGYPPRGNGGGYAPPAAATQPPAAQGPLYTPNDPARTNGYFANDAGTFPRNIPTQAGGTTIPRY